MVAIGLMTVVGGALTAGSAGAQEGDSITVEQTHPIGTGAHYFVRVSGATDSTAVTATATGPDGKAGEPVTFEDGGEAGLYQGAVEMGTDGDWTVTFTAKNPDATLEYGQKVPVETKINDGSGSSSSGSDEPSPVVPLVFAGLFVLALIAMGIWALVERGKQPTATAGTADPTDDGSTDTSADAAADDDASVTTTTE
jgi:hypothetical protein